MKQFIIIALLVFCWTTTSAQEAITTFILVRHAEKAMESTPDPNLSEEGKARAERLAQILKDTQIQLIYSTNYKRTIQTVQPVATAKGLEVKTYEPLKKEEVDRMLKEIPGATILISGHSNTIPWTANTLLGTEQFKNFTDSEYDNLIIVTVTSGGSAKATWLKY